MISDFNADGRTDPGGEEQKTHILQMPATDCAYIKGNAATHVLTPY